MPVLHHLSQKSEEEGICCDLYHEAGIAQVPVTKTAPKGKLQTSVSYEHKCKNLEQNIGTQIIKTILCIH